MTKYKKVGIGLGVVFIMSIIIGNLSIEGRTAYATFFFGGGLSFLIFGAIIMYIIVLLLGTLKEDNGCMQLIPILFSIGFLFVYTLFGFFLQPESSMVREDLIVYKSSSNSKEKLILQWWPGYMGKEFWRAILTEEKEAVFRKYREIDFDKIVEQGGNYFLSTYSHSTEDVPFSITYRNEQYLLEENNRIP